MPILSAASPVEIEASADGLALSAPARAAALALFHDLTSREELAAMSLPATAGQRHDGGEWPAHRFLFGTAAELDPLLGALRERPDVAEIGSGSVPEGLVPRTLLLAGRQDGFSAVLLACSDPGRMDEVMAELGVPDAA